MFLKLTICLMLLLNRFSNSQPLTHAEEEDHLNNRLKHYLKRMELVAQKTDNQFSAELKNLMDKFKHSLSKDTFREKSQLLEEFTTNIELADFLNQEFDKQYINEDILIESWYLNEIIPYVDKDLYDEMLTIIHDLKEAYRAEDLDTKFNIYTDIGESISDKLLDYIYGDGQPMPVLNAILKYYQEYLEYLLKDFQVSSEFENDVQDLLAKVAAAEAGVQQTEKETVIDLFDDVTTKFGRYLDEHFIDFKIFKFGE